MRARSFLILSAITLAVTVATGVAVVRQDTPHTTVAAGGPLFPGLIERLGDVAAIIVRDAEHTLTVHRVDGGWALAERNDYPVPADKVREIVRSLVQLEKAEAKTLRADRYARLAVEDPDAPGAKSKEVTLRTGAGTPAAQLIVGNAGAGVGAEGATYVRIPGEAQAWLARGTLNPSIEPRDWVDPQLVQISVAEIGEVRIVHPDGSTVGILRNAPDTPGFRLAELPKGGKLKRPDAVDSIAQAFGDIPLEDLAAGETVAFPTDKTMHVIVTRLDGQKLAFDVVELDGTRWLRFAGDAAPPTLPSAGRGMVFQVPAWKISPLERKLPDLIEAPSGS